MPALGSPGVDQVQCRRARRRSCEEADGVGLRRELVLRSVGVGDAREGDGDRAGVRQAKRGAGVARGAQIHAGGRDVGGDAGVGGMPRKSAPSESAETGKVCVKKLKPPTRLRERACVKVSSKLS